MRKTLFSILLLVGIAPLTSGEEALRVCVDSRPRFFGQNEGVLEGLEHDILSGFAKSQGLHLKPLWDQTFQEIFDRLLRGDCQLVAAMLTPTVEREKRMDFSEPYFPVFSMVLASERHRVYDLADLEGLQVAVIEGTSQHEALAAIPNVRVILGGSYQDLGRIVSEGVAEALVCDSAFVPGLLEAYPSLRVGPAFSGRTHYAFALGQNSDLKSPLDEYIRQVKSDVGYRQILERYFDSETVELIVSPE